MVIKDPFGGGLRKAVIDERENRKRDGLGPSPLYPCDNYEKIWKKYDDKGITTDNIDDLTKEEWDHYDKCKTCDEGWWLNRN